jgi:hypothetical protein
MGWVEMGFFLSGLWIGLALDGWKWVFIIVG